MARTPNIHRTVIKNVTIPEALCARLELELYSDFEGKIPFGAFRDFFTLLLEDYFRRKDLQTEKDLQPVLEAANAIKALTAKTLGLPELPKKVKYDPRNPNQYDDGSSISDAILPVADAESDRITAYNSECADTTLESDVNPNTDFFPNC